MLVERYQKLVYTLALRLVSNPTTGEDVAQEALSAWKGAAQIPDGRQIFHLALPAHRQRAATDLLRRRQKEQTHHSLEDEQQPVQVPGPGPRPGEQAQAAERRAILQRAIASR